MTSKQTPRAVSTSIQPLSVAPMVFHTQQPHIPNSHYHHHQGPVINLTQPSSAQYIQCGSINNNNMLGYPNHIQVHPYPHHQSQHHSLHYSSATPPLPIHGDPQHSSFYFNHGQGIESYSTSAANCHRFLKRDTQSCDDLCSSADISNGNYFNKTMLSLPLCSKSKTSIVNT